MTTEVDPLLERSGEFLQQLAGPDARLRPDWRPPRGLAGTLSCGARLPEVRAVYFIARFAR